MRSDWICGIYIYLYKLWDWHFRGLNVRGIGWKGVNRPLREVAGPTHGQCRVSLSADGSDPKYVKATRVTSEYETVSFYGDKVEQAHTGGTKPPRTQRLQTMGRSKTARRKTNAARRARARNRRVRMGSGHSETSGNNSIGSSSAEEESRTSGNRTSDTGYEDEDGATLTDGETYGKGKGIKYSVKVTLDDHYGSAKDKITTRDFLDQVYKLAKQQARNRDEKFELIYDYLDQRAKGACANTIQGLLHNCRHQSKAGRAEELAV